jgi:hypothetical protein
MRRRHWLHGWRDFDRVFREASARRRARMLRRHADLKQPVTDATNYHLVPQAIFIIFRIPPRNTMQGGHRHKDIRNRDLENTF